MRSFVRATPASPLVLSAVSYPELHSVVARLRRTGYFTDEDAAQVRASVDATWGSIEEEVLSPSIIRIAALLVTKHELRTLDALQLASADAARVRLKRTFRFVSADRKLLEAAKKEGFDVWDPCA